MSEPASLGQSRVSPVEFERLVEVLTDPDVLAGKYLSIEERDEHARCVRSIVEARRHAEAHAHEFYVGGAGR